MYAMSDKEDDLKININSTAILFGNRDREITGFLQCVFFGIFIYIGYLKEYSYIFYLFLLLAIVLGVYNQILISKRNREFCIMAFKNNQYIGMLIFFGIYGEYLI
jgi:4-hydroxybenzoate polyprenyltransferase